MTTRTLVTPVSILATAGSSDLDVSGLHGPVRVILTSLNTAGTSPTLASKLQTSVAPVRGYTYTTEGTLVDNELREGASTNIELAAKFTQAATGQVKHVWLKLKKGGTITAGKLLTLKIETDTTGDPSGTAVANGTSATVDIDTEVSTTAAWVRFTFAKPVDLVAESVYHLVLSGDYSASGSNNVMWQSNTVASGGTFNTSTDGTTFAGVTATQSLLAQVEQYAFADLTGGGFTTLSTAGNTTVQTLEFQAQNLPQFMRVHFTIGGTSNPAFATAATVTAARTQEQA
jgi:hypothetical protein